MNWGPDAQEHSAVAERAAPLSASEELISEHGREHYEGFGSLFSVSGAKFDPSATN
jgi:hypothetical protein